MPEVKPLESSGSADLLPGQEPPVIRRFPSIEKAVEFADQMPSPWRAVRRGHLVSRVEGDPHASGVAAWDEARQLALDGWPEGRRLLEPALTIPRSSERLPAQVVGFDVAGPYPSIPVYLSGDPECMELVTPILRNNRRVYRLTIVSQIDFNTDPKNLLNWGAAVLSIANQIDNDGDYLEISWIAASDPCTATSGRQLGPSLVFEVRLKAIDERIDINRLAFWSMHPASSRRVLAAMKERLDVESSYFLSYGHRITAARHIAAAIRPGSVLLFFDAGLGSVSDGVNRIRRQLGSFYGAQSPR